LAILGPIMDHTAHRRAVVLAILPRVIEAVRLITIAACCCATGIGGAAEDFQEKPYFPIGSAVERLVQAIKDKDIPATEAALKTIRTFGAEKEAATAAEALLSSDDNDLRCLAADAVRQFDAGKATGLLSAFERGLQSKEPRIRTRGALGLAQIGPAARQAIPTLLHAARDEDLRVRASAAQALGSMGSAATEAVPTLEDLLNDPSLPVRMYTVRALSQIGSPSKAAIPGLLWALQQPDSSELRQAAAKALAGIGPEAKVAVAALVARMHDDEQNVRLEAMKSLRAIGPQAREAIPALIAVLKDPNVDLQRMAAMTLGSIGRDADSIAALTAMLKEDQEGNADLRVAAAYAMAAMGPPAKTAIPTLIEALHDRIAAVRAAAVHAITSLACAGESVDVRAAVPHLLQWLDDSDLNVRRQALSALLAIGMETEKAATRLKSGLRSQEVPERRWAAEALGQISSAARASVAELIAAVNHDPDDLVRQLALKALAGTGQQAGVRVDLLATVLGKSGPESDDSLRTWAAGSLGIAGPAAKEAIPVLVAVLRDKAIPVRAAAAYALVVLGATTGDPVTSEFRKQLDDVEQDVCLTSANALGWDAIHRLIDQDVAAISDLRTSLVALQRTKARFTLDARGEQEWSAPIDSVTKAIAGLEAASRAKLLDRLLQNPQFLTWAGVTVGVAALLAAWLLLYWLHPLLLLRIDDALRPLGEITLPDWLGGIKSTLPRLLLVRCFSHRNRVLNAWVAGHLPAASENFRNRSTVCEREIYVPSPIVLDGKPLACPRPEDLDAAFARKRACLLIHGEGGAGKTSLACQIARWAMGYDGSPPLAGHAMLPVLIEQDLDLPSPEAKDPFAALTETIRGQVQALIGEQESLSEELLRALLLRGRILVIVDHFSELSEETRNAVRPGQAGFPASALVVTSRHAETLDDVPKNTVQPLRIEGDRLASFMESYFMQRGKRDLFDDARFFEVCRGLSCLVGTKKTTVLLAKLYADVTISSAEGRAEEGLPDTVPDLVLAHVNELHRNAPADLRRDRLSVHKDAETLAWESLQESLCPSPVPIMTVIATLGGDDAGQRLEYLEKYLGLIKINQPGCDSISFVLDPLAEYLAALWLADKCREKDPRWREFLSRVRTLPNCAQEEHGFLRAVIDCCRARRVGDDLLRLLADATLLARSSAAA
jgi:HEAT repeat protein